jgi:hypothetical protein
MYVTRASYVNVEHILFISSIIVYNRHFLTFVSFNIFLVQHCLQMKIDVMLGNTETLVIDHHIGNYNQTRLFVNKVG